MAQSETQQFDIAVAGAGLAGVLVAWELHKKFPSARLVLIDKEAHPGGRLRSTNADEHRWAFGLKAMTPELYHYWDQLLKEDPEGKDLPAFTTGKYQRAGVLAANKVSEVPLESLWTDKGARMIGGGAAARDWQNVNLTFQKALAGKKGDSSFGHAFEGNRKGPAAVVLEQLAHAWGLPDLWDSSARLVADKAQMCAQGLYMGEWDEAMAALLARLQNNGQFTLLTDSRIVDAKYDEAAGWSLATARGRINAKSLVVAQSPWDAMLWLPKDHCPDTVAAVASKSKPVSIVVLSEKIMTPDVDLPDFLMIPAEEVQVFIHQRQEICFQVTLDYEVTMQAPEVVKAVKRLRRAKKKLLLAYPDLQTQGDHLMLLPVGWAQPTAASERRWAEKLENPGFQSAGLAFCGDAYGPHCDGDKNIVFSVRTACEALDWQPPS